MDPKTRMTPEWIARALQQNPCAMLESGNIRTCPVRLSFPNVFKPGKPMKEGDEPKHGSALLFPLGADLGLLHGEVLKVARAEFASCFQGDQYLGGLHLPFRDQQDKAKFDGYVPGAIFITATTKFKPAVVGSDMQPILDEARVYPGVWALATLNLFVYRSKMKQGVSFGLQSVMIAADDEKLGGAGGNPNEDYKGVRIETETAFDPSRQFGVAPSTIPSEKPGPGNALAALGLT